MAEALVKGGRSKELQDSKNPDDALVTKTDVEGVPECAVCLQSCVHPAQLPCGHIFCFLCIKGVANQSRRCAMCRQEIPPDYVEKPQLLVQQPAGEKGPSLEDGYQWFYEGRNGWWQYDERTSEELEMVYKLGESSCEIMICGALYVIDFKNGYQYKKYNSQRKRKIKRDLASSPKLGIAGWWQYDERTSRELEASYKRGERSCELLIAGFLYVIDFDAMLQIRRNSPSRKRRIKRDLCTIPKKGIAGLRMEGHQPERDVSTSSVELFKSSSQSCPVSPSPTPAPPTNTPQTPHTPSVSGESSPDSVLESDVESIQRAVEEIRRLSLQDESWSNREINDENFSDRPDSEDDEDNTETSSATSCFSTLADFDLGIAHEK